MFEIYFNPHNKTLMVEDLHHNEIRSLKEMDYSFFKNVEFQIKTNYPEAHDILINLYGYEKEFAYARVRHFLSCNFQVKTGKPNIDEDWNLMLQDNLCPARETGSCKFNKKLCNLKLESNLTERETEVLRLFAKGFSEEEIADVLFISKNTIHNHINNMYRKLDLSGKTSPDRKLVNYAHVKGII